MVSQPLISDAACSSRPSYASCASSIKYHSPPSDSILAMTLLSTLLHATNYSNPFLRTLIPSVSLAYGIQGLVAIPSVLAQSEKFYDLSGSLTYLSCTLLSLYLPTLRARAAAAALGAVKPAWPSVLGALAGKAGAGLNWRQVVLSAAVSVWATRRRRHPAPPPPQFPLFVRPVRSHHRSPSYSGILPLPSHFR